MITYDTLKGRSRDFLAATSLEVAEFDQLVPIFTAAYTQLYPPQLTRTGQPRQRQPGSGSKGTLMTPTE